MMRVITDKRNRDGIVFGIGTMVQEVLKASPSHESSQSPEVLSKEGSGHEEVNDKVRHLSEKLSAALSNISSKEDLVKQHAKVAEEAVSGIFLTCFRFSIAG